MCKRYVTLGDGRAIGLGAYVAAWRAAATAPAESTFKGAPSDPRGSRGSYSRGEVLAEFRAGLHDRINRHLPGYGRGRKWESDYCRAMLQASIRLNTPRLIIDWLPADLKTRFAHRLRENRA